jgi:hypothetical protein
MRRRLTADGSSSLRMVIESCHHSPSTGPRRPSVSIALRSFWLIARTSAGLVVADGGQSEEVARQLRTVRVEDERAPDAERAAEQPGLEHHVVARRRLAGLGRIRRGPVVLGEHERGEIDFLGELDQSVEGGSPRVERGRPGLDVGDVREPACDRLEQFGLLARRPEEDARLVHVRFTLFGQETRASVLDSIPSTTPVTPAFSLLLLAQSDQSSCFGTT